MDKQDENKAIETVNDVADYCFKRYQEATAKEEIDGWLEWSNRLQDALELLKEQQPKWIPINERLPKEKETVLLSDGYDVSFGYMTTNRDFIFVDDALSKDDLPIKSKKCWGISHWMPLPKIPKDGDGE